MNLLKKVSLCALLTLVVFSGYLFAGDISVSGDVTGVSMYVWRGVKQFDGVAVQGTVTGVYKMVSVGVWYSSVEFGVDSPFFEADPFVEVALPTGKIGSAVGATVYTYDFSKFNDRADLEYELYLKLKYGPIGLASFFVPSQGSTEGDGNESPYWLELSGVKSLLGVDLGLTYGFGTYSSRFVPTKDPVGTMVLSATKSLAEKLSVSWKYSVVTDSDMKNTAWVGISRTF